MVKKALILFILLILPISPIKANDDEIVNKEKLIYEITNIEMDEKYLKISGWAFIHESQHYTSNNDYSGYLMLSSVEDNKYYEINFVEKDLTSIMKMDNRRRCNDNEYNARASICYYDLKNVGFNLNIPLSDLIDNTTYFVTLGINAKEANKAYRISVYAYTNEMIIYNNDRIIRMNTNINDSSFYVNQNYVLVKNGTDKNASRYYGTSSCSLEYGNLLYFEKNSTYQNILSKTNVDNISYYKVLFEEKGCTDGMNVVREAENGYETYIASPFVEYSGNTLRLKIEKYLQSPVINANDMTIYVNDESFNILDNVSATDSYDGELPVSIVYSNLNIHQVGKYMVMLRAINSKKRSTAKVIYINVIERPLNNKPVINASNKYIKQYSNFDYMENVSAYDIEEGDITDRIEILNTIDTSLINPQELCYYVEDNEGLNDKKCINVFIEQAFVSKNTKLRFIDMNSYLKQTFSYIWNDSQALIRNVLKLNSYNKHYIY